MGQCDLAKALFMLGWQENKDQTMYLLFLGGSNMLKLEQREKKKKNRESSNSLSAYMV